MTSSRSYTYQTGQRRYTVHEAALLLGLSVEAVRKHAEKGKLTSIKYEDGTRHILLDLIRESPDLVR
jgi:excisionase family DNA binding protein